MTASTTNQILGPSDGRTGQIGGLGVRFMVDGAESGGGFALVEHPMSPHALGSPLHRHTHEDEYTYVLEGHVGIQLEDEVVHAQAGDMVFKPRGQWHAFWNAGEEPARILEIISPGGFESYFEQLSRLFEDGRVPSPDELMAVASEHNLEVDPTSIPRLMEEYGLR
jgi:quercetin dioxygenase-like cupin family protein